MQKVRQEMPKRFIGKFSDFQKIIKIMINLNSIDIIEWSNKLSDLAKEYDLKGSTKFSIGAWKFDTREDGEVDTKFSFGYVELGPFNTISETESDKDIYVAFEKIKQVFIKLQPK